MVLLPCQPVGAAVAVTKPSQPPFALYYCSLQMILAVLLNGLRLIVCPGCSSFSPCESVTHHFPHSTLHNDEEFFHCVDSL